MSLKLFLIALPVFFAIDMIWLGVIAKGFYREQLGPLMRGEVNWVAAVVFYLIFIIGLVVLVIGPATDAGSWSQALVRGGLFGLVSYATYDLTNLATLKGWSRRLALLDIAWGTTVSAAAGAAAWLVLAGS